MLLGDIIAEPTNRKINKYMYSLVYDGNLFDVMYNTCRER